MPKKVRPKAKSVFHDLYDPDQAAAAKVLGVTQARVSDIKRGAISRFSLDLLVRLASQA